MPSSRKRIGYLPSLHTQQTITKIATKEKLSQSKVVGILVEEALLARGEIDFQNANALIIKNKSFKENNLDYMSLKYNDVDELISDKGITYNTKKYQRNSKSTSSETREAYNEELLEQFKQFIQFQNMMREK